MANENKQKKAKRTRQTKKTDDLPDNVNDGAMTNSAANARNQEIEIFGKEKWLEDIKKESKQIHKGKKRVWVWSNFTEDPKYNLVACVVCKKLLHYTSPTTEMIDHLL